MMEEIDFSDAGTKPSAFGDLWESNPPQSSGTTPSAAAPSTGAVTSHRNSHSHNNNNNSSNHYYDNDNDNDNDTPLRLPRTGGSLGSRATFFRDTVRSQIPTQEQIRKRTERAGQAWKMLGNKFQNMNLGRIIDQMEQDQGLADSLEALNSRMKEEVERHSVRREAEELSMKVITDHLHGFLEAHPEGTYEEWISDLHPENANQGKLLADIQQIDDRFYVMESDHRLLWNTAVEEQQSKGSGGNDGDGDGDGDDDDRERWAHRLVEARTQIWGKAAPGGAGVAAAAQPQADTLTEGVASIDLLGDGTAFSSTTTTTTSMTTTSMTATTTTTTSDHNDNDIEEIDFFAPVATIDGAEATQSVPTNSSADPFDDLIKF